MTWFAPLAAWAIVAAAIIRAGRTPDPKPVLVARRDADDVWTVREFIRRGNGVSKR